jgi:hypothetical protein
MSFFTGAFQMRKKYPDHPVDPVGKKEIQWIKN